MMTRRKAIKTTALATAACATMLPAAKAQQPAVVGMFTLPPLPYSYDALEPHIDAQTMQIHHDKHHQAYVTNLNAALAKHPDLPKQSIEKILTNLPALPEDIRTAVQNNGGGHYNHTLFWQMMKKNGGGEPKGELAAAIEKKYKSFPLFREELAKAGVARFGSGWAWLVLDDKQQLGIESTANQDSPISAHKTPLLGVDVWEHAYYLRYQNRRPEYILAWFNTINWDYVTDRYQKNLP